MHKYFCVLYVWQWDFLMPSTWTMDLFSMINLAKVLVNSVRMLNRQRMTIDEKSTSFDDRISNWCVFMTFLAHPFHKTAYTFVRVCVCVSEVVRWFAFELCERLWNAVRSPPIQIFRRKSPVKFTRPVAKLTHHSSLTVDVVRLCIEQTKRVKPENENK